jgi:hypothetical protein
MQRENTTYVNSGSGLSRAYAAECHKMLEPLQPKGKHLGLLELCKLAMDLIGTIRVEGNKVEEAT